MSFSHNPSIPLCRVLASQYITHGRAKPWATLCSGIHQGRSEPCHHLLTSCLHGNRSPPAWLFHTLSLLSKSSSDSPALHREDNSDSSLSSAQLLFSLPDPCAGWTRTWVPPLSPFISESKPDPGICEQYQWLYSQSTSLATFLFCHLCFSPTTFPFISEVNRVIVTHGQWHVGSVDRQPGK